MIGGHYPNLRYKKTNKNNNKRQKKLVASGTAHVISSLEDCESVTWKKQEVFLHFLHRSSGLDHFLQLLLREFFTANQVGHVGTSCYLTYF